MKNYGLKFIVALLFSLPVFASNLAQATPLAYEYHVDASMAHKSRGPVEKAYGYLNVVAVTDGKVIVNVMFSNGNQSKWARFNARVKFLSASGRTIKEENFERWIAAAGLDGASEQRISKALTISNFKSIEVDFYLSDVPDKSFASKKDSKRITVSDATSHLEN
ncbi:MAG: hypothetical protein GY896_01315 [Gammaproteobacteria bacterium]|nr:hypothetical protein [Gammaproteobacteria bacterium]